MHRLGVGIAFISPHNDVIPMSYKLSFECSNNMVEYEVLIHKLKQLNSHNFKAYDHLHTQLT